MADRVSAEQNAPASFVANGWLFLDKVSSILTYLTGYPLSYMSYVSGYPLLGVLPEMCRGGLYSTTLKQLFEAAKEDGISYAHMAVTPLVYLRDPKIIRHVLVDSSASHTRIDLDGQGPWGVAQRIAGDVLFTVEGPRRQKWHSAFLKSFNNTPSMQRLFPDLVSIADRYAQNMLSSPESNDLFRLLEDFALDTAWKVTLGVDHMSTLYPEISPAFMEYSDIVGNPAHVWLHYLRSIASGKKFNEPDVVERSVGERFHKFLEEILNKHTDKIDPTGKENTPLNILQQASKESGGTSEAPITEDVMAQARQVLSLAHTPPALFLLWTIYELSYHPDKVEKLRQELKEGGWNKDKREWGQIHGFKYLDAIVNEIFRIHPPISATTRMVTKPINVQTENGKMFTVQPSNYIITSVHYLHHDPEVWGENADEFCPERWFNLQPKTMENRCEFMPFLSGPKRCVASGFVMAEIKVLLATLYSEIDIDIVDRDEIQKHIDAVVTPENPIRFHAKKRVQEGM